VKWMKSVATCQHFKFWTWQLRTCKNHVGDKV